MARRTAAMRTATDSRTGNTRDRKSYEEPYVDGSAVRKARARADTWQMEEPRKIPSHEVRKNQEKARYMSPGYMMLLLAALCLTAFLLIGHVRLMAELTARTQAVTKLTVAVNDLKIQNDENYNQIVSGIDLGEIKRVAIGELGMVFPGEGQVVLYADVKRDYFRKLSGTGE